MCSKWLLFYISEVRESIAAEAALGLFSHGLLADAEGCNAPLRTVNLAIFHNVLP